MSRKDVWVSSTEHLLEAIQTGAPREGCNMMKGSSSSPPPYFVHLERADPWSDAAKRGDGFVFAIELEQLLSYHGPELHIVFDADLPSTPNAAAAKKRPALHIWVPPLRDAQNRMALLNFRLHFSCVDIFVRTTVVRGELLPLFISPMDCLSPSTYRHRHDEEGEGGVAMKETVAPRIRPVPLFHDSVQSAAGWFVEHSNMQLPAEFVCVGVGGVFEVKLCRLLFYKPPPCALTVADPPHYRGAIRVRAAACGCVSPSGAAGSCHKHLPAQLTSLEASWGIMPIAPRADSDEPPSQLGGTAGMAYFQALDGLIVISTDETAEATAQPPPETTPTTTTTTPTRGGAMCLLSASQFQPDQCPWGVAVHGANAHLSILNNCVVTCGENGAIAVREGARCAMHDSRVVAPAAGPPAVHGHNDADGRHLDHLRVQLLPAWYPDLLKSDSHGHATDKNEVAEPAQYCGILCVGPASSILVHTVSVFPTAQNFDDSSSSELPCGRAALVVSNGGRAECTSSCLQSTFVCAVVHTSDPGQRDDIGLRCRTTLVTHACVMNLIPPTSAPPHILAVHQCIKESSLFSSLVVLVEGTGSVWTGRNDAMRSTWTAPIAVSVVRGARVEWEASELSNCHRIGVRVEGHTSTASLSSMVRVRASHPRIRVPADREVSYCMGGSYPTTIGIEVLSSGPLNLGDVCVEDFEIGFYIGTKRTGDVHHQPLLGGERRFTNCRVLSPAASFGDGGDGTLIPDCCFACVGVDGSAVLVDCSCTGGGDTPRKPARVTAPICPLDGCNTFLRIEAGASVSVVFSQIPEDAEHSTCASAVLLCGAQAFAVGGQGSSLSLNGGHTTIYVYASNEQRSCGGVYVHGGSTAEVTNVTFRLCTSDEPAPPSSWGVLLDGTGRFVARNVRVENFECGFGTVLTAGRSATTTSGQTDESTPATMSMSLMDCTALSCQTAYAFLGGKIELARCFAGGVCGQDALVGCASRAVELMIEPCSGNSGGDDVEASMARYTAAESSCSLHPVAYCHFTEV